MPAVSTHNTQGKAHPMRNYVRTQLQSGADLETIVAELGKSGVDEQMAHKLVNSVSQDGVDGSINPSGDAPSIQMAVLGALAASLIAGAIWGGVALLTGWELGLMAWVVGAAVGYAVLIFAKGEPTSAHQIVALVFSFFGILVGRYVTFYAVLKAYVTTDIGPDTAANMSIFSFQLFGEFLGNLGDIMGAWDLMWMAFACITAWKLTSPSNV